MMRRVILGGAEWGSMWETLPGRAGVRGLEGVGCVKGRAMGRVIGWVIMGGIRQEVGDRVVVGVARIRTRSRRVRASGEGKVNQVVAA